MSLYKIVPWNFEKVVVRHSRQSNMIQSWSVNLCHLFLFLGIFALLKSKKSVQPMLALAKIRRSQNILRLNVSNQSEWSRKRRLFNGLPGGVLLRLNWTSPPKSWQYSLNRLRHLATLPVVSTFEYLERLANQLALETTLFPNLLMFFFFERNITKQKRNSIQDFDGYGEREGH